MYHLSRGVQKYQNTSFGQILLNLLLILYSTAGCYKKIEIHSRCEIENFVETHHLCNLCVLLRSRVLLGVSPH